ncbi:MAG TPA: topoisomerase DNA-binding C4 zinc finger domain-containing protein, partial [Candidatus Hydrogenedentes bacterium]|nr:topoisomerase DNA-binding C4 zinc finger domain-containing protein [Candidatus Hydrogenedentota bacterium]
QERIGRELLGGETQCPECGSPFEMREGRFGIFMACANYPKCKTTRRLSKKAEAQPTDEICDKCGAPMVIRNGRFGKFLACSTYPQCKNTHRLNAEGKKVERPKREAPVKTDQVCPTCGAFLEIRCNRTGEPFYGCEKYPKCRFTKPKELDLACPMTGCDGKLVSKRGKGRRFIGCDKYPACDFTVFGQLDLKTSCDQCGHAWTTLVKSKDKTPIRKCPVCKHEAVVLASSDASE